MLGPERAHRGRSRSSSSGGNSRPLADVACHVYPFLVHLSLAVSSLARFIRSDNVRQVHQEGKRKHKRRSESTIEAPLAQTAERLHGKEKVYGSIP